MGDFDAFEHTNDIGFHFGTRETAMERALQVRGVDLSGPGERLIVAHLDVVNPLEMPDLGDWNPRAVTTALQAAGILSDDFDDEGALIDLAFVEHVLGLSGYDSIIYDNRTEEGGHSWIVFDPTRIHIAARETLTPEN
ncbi:hypothetical protein [Erythrobacter aureus]|nr:hypothetical protein [Erythrobacter aureus]